MTHLFKAAAAGIAFAAFAMPASAVTSAADCEYEGGEVFDVAEGKVCMVPIRAEEFHGEEYDGQQLGIKDCNGEETMEGAWCKIVLVPAPKAPEDADAEMISDEEMEDAG